MPPSRTKAILDVLRTGKYDKFARAVMKVFGASSMEECYATYEVIGAAERKSLDEVVERVTADAGAAFWLSVESKMS